MSTDEHTVPTLIPVLDARPRRGPATRRSAASLRWLSYILLALGVLAFVWTFVIWKWGDPVTALYTRYEQHQLAKQYVEARRARREDAAEGRADRLDPGRGAQIAKEAATLPGRLEDRRGDRPPRRSSGCT